MGGALKQSQDGTIWINRTHNEGAETIRFRPDMHPPETEITLSLDKVSQTGNTVIYWEGTDPLWDTSESELQYAWRLDGGAWSHFSPDNQKVFFALPSGDHTFEVKTRDRDLNEDQTPAVIHFTVIAPVWRQPWFIGLMVLLLSVIGYQTGRVVLRGQRLQTSNDALSEANVELTQDRALERLRATVGAIKSTENLRTVVKETVKELSALGMDFDVCIVNIVDEEAAICRQYGATKGGQFGQAEMPISRMSETFLSVWKAGRPVVRQMDDTLIDRHIESRKEMGLPDDIGRPVAILNVPLEHGTLSLSTTTCSEGFSDEDLYLGSRFGQVISMGYARFLDFQRLEEQAHALERSKVLTQTAGAATHEINQPLTVLMGEAELIKRQISPDDRHRRGIEAIHKAGENISKIVKKMKDIRQYVTKPYVGSTDIVDFDRASREEKKRK